MLGVPYNEKVLLKKVHRIFRENSYLALFILTIAILGGIIVSIVYRSNNQICPFDFIDRNDRFASFSKWEKEFRVNNPNANISDLAKARKQFYIENNCEEAPQQPRLENYGIKQTGEVAQQFLNIIENYNL